MRRWRGHHHRRFCNHECARRSGKVALGRRLRAASRAEEHPAHAGDLRAAVPRTSPPYPRTSVPAPRRLRLLKPAEEALKTKKNRPEYGQNIGLFQGLHTSLRAQARGSASTGHSRRSPRVPRYARRALARALEVCTRGVRVLCDRSSRALAGAGSLQRARGRLRRAS